MISEEQKMAMLKNLSNILKELPNCKNIPEISAKTGIPTSTIQRYLNNEKLIIELLQIKLIDKETYDKTFETIEDWLKNAKTEGHRKGGITSQERHGYSKDELGKFEGSRKTK